MFDKAEFLSGNSKTQNALSFFLSNSLKFANLPSMNLRLHTWLFAGVHSCLWLLTLCLTFSANAFQIEPSIGTNGFFRVQFPTMIGYDYLLYWGPEANEAYPMVYRVRGTGGVCELEDSNPPTDARSFYRVRQLPLHLVINEIDYDQIGTDAFSFIEIYNPSLFSVSLTDLAVVLVDGVTNGEYNRFNLSQAAPVLSAGGYLVIRNNAVEVPGMTPTIDVVGDFIQNGSPDGLALVDTSAQTLIDALSYGGSITNAQITGFTNRINLVEGNRNIFFDSNTANVSLIRYRNGLDTDDAIFDWNRSFTPTPGTFNQ